MPTFVLLVPQPEVAKDAHEAVMALDHFTFEDPDVEPGEVFVRRDDVAGLLAHQAPSPEDGRVTDDRVAEVLHLLTNEVEARSSEWEEVRTEAAFKRARRIILNAFGLRIQLDVPEHVREGWRLGMLRNTHKVPLWHTCPTEDDDQPASIATPVAADAFAAELVTMSKAEPDDDCEGGHDGCCDPSVTLLPDGHMRLTFLVTDGTRPRFGAYRLTRAS